MATLSVELRKSVKISTGQGRAEACGGRLIIWSPFLSIYGWRTFLRQRTHTADNLRRHSFACGNMRLAALHSDYCSDVLAPREAARSLAGPWSGQSVLWFTFEPGTYQVRSYNRGLRELLGSFMGGGGGNTAKQHGETCHVSMLISTGERKSQSLFVSVIQLQRVDVADKNVHYHAKNAELGGGGLWIRNEHVHQLKCSMYGTPQFQPSAASFLRKYTGTFQSLCISVSYSWRRTAYINNEQCDRQQTIRTWQFKFRSPIQFNKPICSSVTSQLSAEYWNR
jgi:hypothetical protein